MLDVHVGDSRLVRIELALLMAVTVTDITISNHISLIESSPRIAFALSSVTKDKGGLNQVMQGRLQFCLLQAFHTPVIMGLGIQQCRKRQ